MLSRLRYLLFFTKDRASLHRDTSTESMLRLPKRKLPTHTREETGKTPPYSSL